MTRLKGGLKAIARAILWPISRFFDPRFAGIAAAVQADTWATMEATDLLARSLDESQARIDARLDEHERLIGETREHAAQAREQATHAHEQATHAHEQATHAHHQATHAREQATHAREEAAHASGRYFERLVGGSVNEIDQSAAQLLNYAASHEGFAAQRDLWLNQPISLAYEPGGVRLTNVNERIVEIPHVYRALARLEPGAKVADVGAAESLVAFSLALLGYDVTAIDLRPYPFEHPKLQSVTSAIEEWEHDGTFDALICLSTIEHVGLGAYGEEAKNERADLEAMRRMRELTTPGGLLVLTTRFGRPSVNELERTYDKAGLDELLAGWNVEELTILRREDETTWALADGTGGADDGAEKVVLVTATRA